MQLRSATSIDDENPLDVPLGVSSYKALQVKNYFSGSLMIMGGIGLLLAGSAGAELSESRCFFGAELSESRCLK